MFCNETLLITSNEWFWGSEACKLFLAPLSIVMNVLLIWTLVKCHTEHLHINVRGLLINISFCSIMASVCLLIKCLRTGLVWIFNDPCNLQMSYSRCNFEESFYIFFKLPILGSILCLAIERYCALSRANTYHNFKKSLLIAMLLITWGSSFIITCVLTTTVSDGLTAYCNGLSIYNSQIIQVLAPLLILLEICGVIAYTSIWVISAGYFKPNFTAALEFSLIGRYQKQIAIEVTNTMLPSSICNAVFWISILVIVTIQTLFIDPTSEGHIILFQYLFYVLPLLHMFIHPIFCFTQCNILKVHLIKLFCGKKCYKFDSKQKPRRKQEKKEPFKMLNKEVKAEKRRAQFMSNSVLMSTSSYSTVGTSTVTCFVTKTENQ